MNESNRPATRVGNRGDRALGCDRDATPQATEGDSALYGPILPRSDDISLRPTVEVEDNDWYVPGDESWKTIWRELFDPPVGMK